MATYYLIRHGTTAWVDRQLLHGVTDIPLNDNGLRQAAKTAEALKGLRVQHLLSSPLSRAMQTAELIGQAVGLTPEPRAGLIEINFGWMEGKQIHDDTMGDHSILQEKIDHYWLSFIRLVSGESLNRFRKRVINEWNAIRDSLPDEDAIIVCHSGVLTAILEYCFGNAYRGSKPYYITHPCSITEIKTVDNRCYQLVRLNDHSHLKEWYPDEH